jgi:streptomycin 6-kinase
VGDDVMRVVTVARTRLRGHPDAAPVLDGLADLLTDLVARWSLTLGEVYSEGIGGPVVAVEADGRPAVLKVDLAGSAFTSQVATLRAAAGRGYAAWLADDVARGAVLLERLGPSLASAGLQPHEQLDQLAATLHLAWEVPLDTVPEARPLQDKATQLVGIIGRHRRAEDEPRWGRHLEMALELAQHLAATRDLGRDVLCHGDPHQGNALLAQGGSYKLVDPDGLRCEPEYDAGVALRDFSREVLEIGDPSSARAWHGRLCRRLAEQTGTDPERVAQWAFVERVTTGLYLRWFDDVETAESFLDAATLLAT